MGVKTSEKKPLSPTWRTLSLIRLEKDIGLAYPFHTIERTVLKGYRWGENKPFGGGIGFYEVY